MLGWQAYFSIKSGQADSAGKPEKPDLPHSNVPELPALVDQQCADVMKIIGG
ncbi:hypothetical protein [Morganella psychrotolerans]|uniref:hypothetical protein n=1 Tax=Morganella psychrotolerans TaxID=368603 RepID=UPI0039AF254C